MSLNFHTIINFYNMFSFHVYACFTCIGRFSNVWVHICTGTCILFAYTSRSLKLMSRIMICQSSILFSEAGSLSRAQSSIRLVLIVSLIACYPVLEASFSLQKQDLHACHNTHGHWSGFSASKFKVFNFWTTSFEPHKCFMLYDISCTLCVWEKRGC